MPTEIDRTPPWSHMYVSKALELPNGALRIVHAEVDLGAYMPRQLNLFRDAIKSRMWFGGREGESMLSLLFPQVEVYHLRRHLEPDSHFHTYTPADFPWTPEGLEKIRAYRDVWQAVSGTNWHPTYRKDMFMLDETMSPKRARKFLADMIHPRGGRADEAAERALERIASRAVVEITLTPHQKG